MILFRSWLTNKRHSASVVPRQHGGRSGLGVYHTTFACPSSARRTLRPRRLSPTKVPSCRFKEMVRQKR